MALFTVYNKKSVNYRVQLWNSQSARALMKTCNKKKDSIELLVMELCHP